MDIQTQKTEEHKNKKTRVRVAIRVRPMIPKEIANNENSCVQFQNNNQVILAKDKNYKFDHVFKQNSHQNSIYDACVKDLVLSCFDGYNSAILAYGQTGSGKTFTMGTSISSIGSQNQQGIIPRVIGEIFDQVKLRQKKAQFIIKASFLQIYNEQILDLLSDSKSAKMKDHVISIREQKDGSVSICNVVEEQVTTSEQMMDLLERGGYHRTTASTMMNDASSRSHAIFTIFIEQHVIEDLYKNDEKKKEKSDVEDGFMTAKFFFVDLAGSQRAKKTGATGSTLKEGININLGLLELGNVISALATIQKKQSQFITYRNSKLTRILQDCLGGNSNTYMIACISPAQSNYEQSLNTLKYASKAMNIKNTPIINRDPQSALISQLRQKIYELEVQNRKLKGLLNQKGVNVEEEINKSPDIMFEEVKKLKKLYVNLQKKYEQSLAQLKEEKRIKSRFQIELYDMKRDRDIALLKLESLKEKYPEIDVQKLQDEKEMGVLNELTQKIQTLTSQMKDKDKLYDQLQRQFSEIQKNSKKDEHLLIAKNNQIHHLKKDNQKLKKQIKIIKEEMVMNRSLSQSDMSSSAILTQANNSLLEDVDEKLQDQDLDESEYHEYMTPELQEHQEKFHLNHQETQSRLNSVDRQISQKQHYLQTMSTNQIKLEYQLISEMKEQYHHKITMLQRQKTMLVKQKDETVGQNQKNKFINKIDNLQTQLKDYRKKTKEQKNLQKLVGNQSEKIKDLANDIKKFKVQKIQLGRKLKEDKDVFQKYKSKKIKELLKARKENVKKDNQIKKMKLQHNIKAQSFKKKEQQLKKQKKINDTFKNLIKSNKTNRTTKDQVHHEVSINSSQVDEHVVECIQKMLGQIDQEKTLMKYQNKIKQLQEQIKALLTQDSGLRLKIERYKLKQEEQEEFTEEQLTQKEQINLNLNDFKERISNAQDNLSFCKNKYNEVLVSNPNIFDLETEIIYRKNYETVEGLRTFVKSLFPTIRNILFDNYGLYQIKQQLQIQINSKNIALQEYQERIIKINSEHQHALEHLREDMMVRYYSNMEDQQPTSSNLNMKRMEEREKKNFERKIVDLTKTNRQLSHEVQMWRRKCNVVQQKYQNIRSLLSKDKNIGRQREEDIVPKDKKLPNRSSLMLDEINEMTTQLDKLDKLRKVTSNNEEATVQKKEQTDVCEYTVNKWECLGKIDAHNSSVLSIAAHANMLISTSTRSLKIWDLQTSKIISDLSGAHLTGLVKYVMVDPQRNIMLTACEKVITIWDLITLNVQCSLKAHKDQVRTMHIVNDVLFTGGKGLANSGSLLIWDLRHLDPNKPQQEKQRNQDIFTFASKDNTLYYGTRNHHVRRMDLKNMEILSPFQPPHMDTVTGLAVVGNKLVSGSKDKNLRLWNLDHSISNLKNTTNAFNDYVTTLQSDNSLSIFYTASKDGQVKVGSVKNEKIQFVGGILAHSQAVNAISPLEDSNAIVTASADKTIKLWRPSTETVEKIEKEFL